MDSVLLLVLAAWAAIIAMLLWVFVQGVRRVFWGPQTLPFFQMLERHGLAPWEVEQLAGGLALAHALRRCAQCPAGPECLEHAVDCPNEAFLRRVRAMAAP